MVDGPALLALAGGVVACGACLQGAVGFGFGLLAAPVLALLAPDLVPVPLIMLAVVTAGVVAVRERRCLDVHGLSWALAGRVPGTLAGAVAVVLLPRRELIGLFGLAILAVVTVSLSGWRPVVTRGSLLTVGVASGVMGTMTSIGAPPFALLYQNAAGPRVRATLAWYLMLGSSMSLVVLTAAGQVGVAEVRAAVVLAPCVALGFLASRKVVGWLDQGRTRAAMLTVTSAAALGLVVQSVLAY